MIESSLTALAFAALLIAAPALAQHHATPYSGQQKREIRSFDAAQIEDVRAGRGMGLAKPAELNAYPGPQHVLELADALQLTPQQRAASEALIAPMRAEAKQHGAEWLAHERELDRLFESRAATPEAVQEVLDRAAAAQARVRAAHLNAHIAQRALLSEAQIATYVRLRGYAAHASDAPSPAQHQHQHR